MREGIKSCQAGNGGSFNMLPADFFGEKRENKLFFSVFRSFWWFTLIVRSFINVAYLKRMRVNVAELKKWFISKNGCYTNFYI